MRRALNREQGFSLIELAIVIIVSGIIFVTLFQGYAVYVRNQELRTVKENIKAMTGQVSYFFSNSRRYPCPADRSLGPGDANYGRQFDANCDPAAIGLTVGNCTANNGICMVAGARDADGDTVLDPVLIGALPIHDMRDTNQIPFSDKEAMDPWGSKLTYAVSANLTRSGPNNKFYNGVIDARDEFNNTTAGITQDGHYVILSHGMDRKGAFTLEGSRPTACGALAAAVDNENCNDSDAIFTQALALYEGDTPNFFDDFVYFATMKSTSLWAYYYNEQHIYNLNTNNIGIGTDTPAERLTVNGTIRADNNTLTTQICNTDGSNCFSLQSITSSGFIRCGAGEVMDGIDEGAADCETPTFSPLTPNVDCGAGRWVHGIRTDGSVICWP